ncbi:MULTISPECIES: type VI secretion system baseplate subunit TssE [Citrobacter]|uniref:Type VI secretion system baseplate subunit TssE n=1 Tax=Citrobacter cronae TaxID=1748967 RepID=A0A7X1EHS8_9ENTR|nr:MULTISPECIES: type VI secretion system baseplate subunit TssE [Citrobacter]MBS6075218.1 type VI secretion system baseplate subunit TssE [Citrobacter freundii]MBC2621153.1 type VI secretion system baseplate subunit TssE [Citrobacter cronae]MBJ8367922.1 type VI secretion system baseplate subunit TssE [Citrobacter cronae]MBJ8396420.1 type VI secretion system baseplate subunit TssE [Citrobacter cronae]MBJ8409926.1 type VI secretion system baseplate subunit TssE [Citrobacter cronae]
MPMSLPVALLDRLMDEDITPRESVCRELRRLFNSRAAEDADTLPVLLAWGVPEWHGLNAGDERVLRWYCRQLRAVILRHEPRIQALIVSVKDAHHQTLALQLDAMLWNDDEPLTLELAYQNGGWR